MHSFVSIVTSLYHVIFSCLVQGQKSPLQQQQRLSVFFCLRLSVQRHTQIAVTQTLSLGQGAGEGHNQPPHKVKTESIHIQGIYQFISGTKDDFLLSLCMAPLTYQEKEQTKMASKNFCATFFPYTELGPISN